MISSLFQTSTIPVLEQVANFSQSRHSILAGNIANFDVPGYRTRDLSPEQFQARLKKALETRELGLKNQSLGSAGHPQGDPVQQVSKDLNNILYHDDSNVSLDRQVMEITKNQLQHNLALTLMSSQFRLLQSAISERV